MPSPYVVTGTPPPLPFSTHPFLPTPKAPAARQPHFHHSNSSFKPLPPSAEWR
jgi:hypothetical protein